MSQFGHEKIENPIKKSRTLDNSVIISEGTDGRREGRKEGREWENKQAHSVHR